MWSQSELLDQIDELERENRELRANQILGYCKDCKYGEDHCTYWGVPVNLDGYCHEWKKKVEYTTAKMRREYQIAPIRSERNGSYRWADVKEMESGIWAVTPRGKTAPAPISTQTFKVQDDADAAANRWVVDRMWEKK